jgi:DNA-binding transcriptional LysR family regulator
MTRAFDPIQLGSIELFLMAAETESFSGAAEALGVTPAAVSRSIARLEERVGVRLFVRTTRRVRLTDDGRVYADQCRQALSQLREAERVLSGRQSEPTGDLRISVPTTYGHHRVLPLLPEFVRRYPKISVEVNIDNRNIDLIETNFDLAIRLGEPEESRLIARKLEDAALGVYAAPSYLKMAGTPKTLADLAAHSCIDFILPSSGKSVPWRFLDKGKPLEHRVKAQVRCSQDVLGCVSFAAAGGGLYQTYDFIAADRVRSGALIEVLKPYKGRSRPFNLLYPQNRHLSAKVRVFVDFLLAEISKPKSRQTARE